MAFPLTCAGALAAMKSGSELCYQNYTWAGTAEIAARAHWDLNQDHACINDMLSALAYLRVAVSNTAYSSPPFDHFGAQWWYFTNCVGVGGVTMSDILLAMLTADFDQLKKFIGVVDAYRVAIWNAPFDAEYYAAIARGFEKWP